MRATAAAVAAVKAEEATARRHTCWIEKTEC